MMKMDDIELMIQIQKGDEVVLGYVKKVLDHILLLIKDEKD